LSFRFPYLFLIMAPLTTVSAALAGICFESALYGMFLIISVLSIIVLLGQWGDGHRPANKVTITTSIVLLLLITTHWALSVTRVFGAFIDSADKPQGSLVYILTIEDPTYVAKGVILIATTALGDAVLIYRVYIVWGRNIWVCIPSIISYVGYVVSGITISVLISQFSPAKISFLPTITRWIQGGGVASLVTNIYSTTMIAFRIWRSQTSLKGTANASQQRVYHALRIFVESAMLYTIATIVSIGCQFGNSTWVGPSLDVISPIVGISFSLILVRLHLGSSNFAARFGSSVGDSSTTPLRHDQQSYARRGLAVHVEHMTTKDSEQQQIFEIKRNSSNMP